ncbi:hypothetical protein D5086_032802 [Populus alba]|uniref:Uncharacterized protein n=1 Tax=Populus alba TaxID=43335 RepID=A0ACC4AF28_POPAL
MGSCSLLSLTLCFLVLFNCCFAQIEQVSSRHGRQQQGQRRSQHSECQIDRINALEPARKIRSEAGVTEIWDENDEQFQCAGVVVIRHTINNRGLLLPAYSNAPKLIFVGAFTELYFLAVQRRSNHQEILLKIEEKAPKTSTRRFDNNPANQLDQDFREFFLAGNPRQESQSQRSSYQRGQYEGQHGRRYEDESRREQQERSRNVFSGFNEQILAEAFNIDTKLARRMQNENDNRGIIVRTQHELHVISPRQSQEEEERQQESRRSTRRRHEDNGVEETFCTARLKININDPEDADVFNPRAGRLTTVNSLNLPILRHVQLSAERGVLYQNALMSPYWNINAHSIMYITGGNGRIQIVGDNGQAVFDGQVRKGQVVTAPQNFAVVMKAGSQGLEWVSFKTNDNAQISQLAGRVSTIRALPEEVVANSFQISREDARRLKNNRDEVGVLSASRQSQYGRD